MSIDAKGWKSNLGKVRLMLLYVTGPKATHSVSFCQSMQQMRQQSKCGLGAVVCLCKHTCYVVSIHAEGMSSKQCILMPGVEFGWPTLSLTSVNAENASGKQNYLSAWCCILRATASAIDSCCISCSPATSGVHMLPIFPHSDLTAIQVLHTATD